MWWILNSLNIPLSVETVCIFTTPVFSAIAAWATYLLTKEVKGAGAGLTAAVLLAMIGQACRPGVKGLGMWGSVKALGRGYEYIMGGHLCTYCCVGVVPICHRIPDQVAIQPSFQPRASDSTHSRWWEEAEAEVIKYK